MKMKNKFQIGDVVEVIGVESGWHEGVGKVGMIVGIAHHMPELYHVEFPERYHDRLHRCDGYAKSGNGWNIWGENLCLVADLDSASLADLL